MAENPSIKADLQEMAALYSIRANMRDFCQNEDNEFARSDVLKAYEKLIDEELHNKITSGLEKYILERLNIGEFNYRKLKTTSAEDDKKLNKETESNKKQNSAVSLIKKQLQEEIAYQASKGREEFQGLENAEIYSVCLQDDMFLVTLNGRESPLKLKHYTYKGKNFSACGYSAVASSKPQKAGIDNKGFKIIAEKGSDGLTLEEVSNSKDLGKKYTPAEYRKLLELERTAKLSDQQEEERAFLNKLTLNDQKTFIIELKKYMVRKKMFKKFIDFVKDTDNKISLLTEPEKLQKILKTLEVEDFTGNLQKQFVHHVQKNKDIWNNFTSNNEYQQRFSRYEILQNNLISNNSKSFAELYQDDGDIKQKIKTAFTKIHHLSEPALPEGLCAEIMTLGIFKEGTKEPLSAQKLETMNKLLNEFGLNISFKSLPVVKAPSAEISNASEQTKIDRQAFELLKTSALYNMEDKNFTQELKTKGITKTDSASTHHYIALRYNGFVETELNDNANLVKTARKNAWNYDGHDTTHLFDMAEEFLVKDSDGKISLTDFTRLRNRFNAGEKLEIQAPVLQIKDEKGKFNDLLALGENGKSGHYISDDKTGQVMSVPEYCRTAITANLTRLVKLKSAKEEKA